MITRKRDKNGNWVELSKEERQRLNQDVLGLDEVRQNEIEAIESGEIQGDAIEVDEEQFDENDI